ncbi:MAG: UvrB/UvrC motif-containing protein, partial [Candidatus Andersenbacteria bacterium]|nr:UvrB/UvrC motif-containing protein [Candidatus Andersenbacteria bacterium]
ADVVTGSMQRAIAETNRRRAIQQRYNKAHRVTPQSITKPIRPGLLPSRAPALPDTEYLDLPPAEVHRVIKELTAKMDLAARNLEFETAAQLRDTIAAIIQHK